MFFAKWVPIFNFWVPVPIFLSFFWSARHPFFFRYILFYGSYLIFWKMGTEVFFCAKTQKTVPKKWVPVSIFFLIFWPKKKFGTHFSKNQDPFFKMGTKKKWVLMLERLKIRYKIYNIFLLCFKNEFLVETDKENYFFEVATTSKTSNNFKNFQQLHNLI